MTEPNSVKDVLEQLAEAEKQRAEPNLSSKQRRARTVSRLAAVQALYQMEVAGKGVNEVFAEFETHWMGREIEGDQYKPAEPAFFRDVVQGVLTDQVAIDRQIDHALSGGWPLARVEAVMRAVLRAAKEA